MTAFVIHSLKTEAEARRSQCRQAQFVLSQSGAMMFPTCGASECMSWRWTVHSKVENMEQRPTGFCGMVVVAPRAVDLGIGDGPINAGEVLNQQPDPARGGLIVPQA